MANLPDNPDRSAPVAELRADTLSDSVMILLGLAAVQRMVGFCRAILFCRWLDPEQLGCWEMAFNFLLLAAPLAVLAIPGAFGRYVEHYRRRGQLRAFLRRTMLLCGCLTAAAGGLIFLARQWFSRLVFGTPDQTEMVALLAVSLTAVVAYNFLTELFTALRHVRLVSIMQFVCSFSFAALGVCLLSIWRCAAVSVMAAYGAACLITAAGACWWLRRTWRSAPPETQPLAQRTLWLKLMPFAGWILLGAVMVNLFEVVDRYMIVHFSSMSHAEALGQVGNYHSSRIVPMLLFSIAAALSTMITPHLSHDWEAGRRDRVAARLRLFLKLFGFALSAAAVVFLLAAPLLFTVALRGKFADGLAVLPWTLTYCAWLSMSMILQNYLWCAERARLVSLALGVGLVVNVCLNLLLLPRMGLLGAVLATSVANLVALVLICTINHLLGFHLDRGARVVLALPPVICLGPWIGLLVLVAVALEAACSDRLLDAEEKRQIAESLGQYVERIRRLASAGRHRLAG